MPTFLIPLSELSLLTAFSLLFHVVITLVRVSTLPFFVPLPLRIQHAASFSPQVSRSLQAKRQP